MKPLTGGLYVAIVTPFDEDEDVDLGAFRAIAEYTIAGGVDGLVVTGTTGEAHALSLEERRLLWGAAVRQAEGRIPIIAGTGATTTRESRQFLALAADCGCDAALALTPWFERATPETIERYYAEMAEGTPLPLVLYQNFSRTHVEWPPEAVAAVAHRLAGPVAGYKDAAGDVDRVTKIRAAAPEGFLIFGGGPHNRAELTRAGADGCIDNLSNALPAEGADAYRGDERMVGYTASVAECLRTSVNSIALLKAMMRQLGLPAGKPRRPHDEVPAEEVTEVRRRLSTCGRLQASPASLMLTDDGGMTQTPAVSVEAETHALAPGLVTDCVAADPLPSRRAAIWRPEPGQYQYSHHASITYFEGRYFAAWSNGLLNEDAPGQVVRFATSDDGLNWTTPERVMPRPEGRLRWTNGGFWHREGRLWLVALRYSRARYVDGEAQPGVCWEGLTTEAFRWDGSRWEPRGIILDDFYVNEAPRALPDGTFLMTGETGRHDAVVAKGGARSVDDWRVAPIASRAEGRKLSEPTWHLTDDGVIRLFMRDDGGSRRLFVSESGDLGETWSTPIATDFTDAQSKICALRLADGRVVMVGNPAPDDVRRRLLAVAVSRDGRTFDRLLKLRFDPAGRSRMPGMHKVPGFGYPNAVEADGRLWVVYAANKEDIEILSVDLSDL